MRTVYRNIGQLVSLQQAAKQDGRRVLESDLSIYRKSALVVEGRRVLWIGPDAKLPKQSKPSKEIDLKQMTVLPGLVECHTHSVFSGSRAEEFEQRLQGASYAEIAAQGGGILSTVKATRRASEDELAALAKKRFQAFATQGVTTVESKSGYALNLKDELKCLRAAKQAAKSSNVNLVSTFLGAHALSPEFASVGEYLDYLILKVLPKVKREKLAERVDIFVENGFYSAEHAGQYLRSAKELGFEVVIHADQLSLSGGTSLAIEIGAKSADHVLQINSEIIKTLAASQTVAVLLPAADLYMKCKYPPARELIDSGACVALATDFNPGSSPTLDIGLVGVLARLEMKMTLPEVICAYTFGAAKALGLERQIGSLEVGKLADFSVWECEWSELFYSVGGMKSHLSHRA